MDQMLNIPVNRPRKRTRLLPVFIGLALLLFTLALMPVREPNPPADIARPE